MKVKAKQLAIMIFVLFFGGIALTMALQLWNTTTDKEPVKFSDGAFEGAYNPADIRGSYTFQEISDVFEIELDVLFKAFNIPEETDGTVIKSKDLEGLYANSMAEVGNSSIQVFVALYKGLPIETDETYLPLSAKAVLLDSGAQFTADQLQYLETYAIVGAPSETAPATDVAIATEASEEPAINGTTTVQQALDLGITQEQLETVLGAPMPPTNQTIKDYCSTNGLSFGTIKTALLELLTD